MSFGQESHRHDTDFSQCAALGARAGHEPATSNIHCDHGVTVVSTRKLPFYPV